jgi:hypothetical protein
MPTEAPSTPDATDESQHEAQARAQVERNQRRREAAEAEAARDDRDGPELIKATADGEELRDTEIVSATEWFLTADDASFTQEIKLNVGTPDKEQWIIWEIKPVDLDTLTKIRKEAAGQTKAQRRAVAAGDMDEAEINIRICVAGTVSPDLRKIANDLRMVDPGDALKARFQRKPGLLSQISGEIMSLSGYDDEDVRAVEAAKNS